MDVLHLLDRLEELIGEGFGVPGTGRVMVDRQRLFELFDELRASIPDSLEHATEVLQQQDRLLEDARMGAQNLREEAEAAYRQKLDQHDLVRAAHAEAERMVDQGRGQAQEQANQAHHEAAERLRQTNEYILLQLRRVETTLDTQLTAIQVAIGEMTEPDRVTPKGA
ncbi:MAG: hypothetical protein EXR52_04480 [Dehalococcoidia bacterium]|nr:hypothetical protein [Dehalococcoidia bacterium]